MAAQMLMSCIIWQTPRVLTVSGHGAENRRPGAQAPCCQNSPWWQTSKNLMAAWSPSVTICRWPKTLTIHYPPPVSTMSRPRVCVPDVCVCVSQRRKGNGSRGTINLSPIKSGGARCQLGPWLQTNFVVWNFYGLLVRASNLTLGHFNYTSICPIELSFPRLMQFLWVMHIGKATACVIETLSSDPIVYFLCKYDNSGIINKLS